MEDDIRIGLGFMGQECLKNSQRHVRYEDYAAVTNKTSL
jgi:hypothetical protein